MEVGRSSYILEGLRVWDGCAEARSDERCAILVRAGRIEEVAPSGAFGDATAAEFFDFSGAARSAGEDVTAIPGLIDSHVHLTLDPDIPNAARQLELTNTEVWEAMCRRAGEMVRAGITTARDLGAGKWQEVALRDGIAAGEIAGPRLLCAGQPLTSPAGHCHFWGGEARGSEEVRAVVERQIRHAVDWIKVMGTGGIFTSGTDPKAPQYTEAELREIVAVAAAHGRPVAVHCHGSAGIANAVGAGVRTVEHCSFAGAKGFGSDFDAALVPRLAKDDLWVSPTVNAGWLRRLESDGAPTPFWDRMSHCLSRLREAGVRMIASTDAGIPGVSHHRLAEGLEAFARYAGMSPVDVLRSATSEAAEALGIPDETGALLAGHAADILVVAGNPLADLETLRTPLFVAARGVVHVSPSTDSR